MCVQGFRPVSLLWGKKRCGQDLRPGTVHSVLAAQRGGGCACHVHLPGFIMPSLADQACMCEWTFWQSSTNPVTTADETGALNQSENPRNPNLILPDATQTLSPKSKVFMRLQHVRFFA